MTAKFVPNSKGFEEVLLGMQPQMDRLAAQVADEVRRNLPDDEGDVIAESYDFTPRGRTGDRAAAAVVVRRPDARILQARSGLLTRAAASAGLEVRADD